MMNKFDIYDRYSSRQARNLFESSISEAVRPWFKDVDSPRVQAAINDLACPKQRSKAARYLGIELIPCA